MKLTLQTRDSNLYRFSTFCMACVVQPIGKFFDKTDNPEGVWLDIPSGDVYRKRFYDALVGIQLYGHEPPHQNWVVKV